MYLSHHTTQREQEGGVSNIPSDALILSHIFHILPLSNQQLRQEFPNYGFSIRSSASSPRCEWKDSERSKANAASQTSSSPT